jgi:RHS repeat-associated protein
MGLGTGPRTSGYESLENGYDGAGNLTWTRRMLSTTRDTYDGNTGTWGRSYKDYSARAASYYDAADKLRAVDKRDDDGKLTPTAYEEYRYDALGRRILLRSRTGTACSVPATCSFQQIQRFVWDGSQIAAEIQYPGATEVSAADLERDTTSITGTDGRYWGRTLYTPGVATDKPLDVIRIGYGLLSGGTYYGTGTTYESFEPLAIAPDWDWRGESHGETYYGPSPQCHAGAGNPSNHCIWIIWPNPAAYGATGRPDLNGWFGSLLQDQRGQTGQAYRRNRYYDPEHGHFTQEDPIGLAGGLNLYGFASGDPINYSDPLGLCGPLMPVCVWILANLPEISIVGAEALTGLSVGGRLAQGGRLTGSALQQAGRAGEAAVEKGLVQEGYTILGRQITARTSVGRRVIDFLVQRPDGTMVAIEAKAGKALRNASQLLKDEKMATEGAELVGKNAPAALKDATVVIPTEVRRP